MCLIFGAVLFLIFISNFIYIILYIFFDGVLCLCVFLIFSEFLGAFICFFFGCFGAVCFLSCFFNIYFVYFFILSTLFAVFGCLFFEFL